MCSVYDATSSRALGDMVALGEGLQRKNDVTINVITVETVPLHVKAIFGSDRGQLSFEQREILEGSSVQNG